MACKNPFRCFVLPDDKDWPAGIRVVLAYVPNRTFPPNLEQYLWKSWDDRGLLYYSNAFEANDCISNKWKEISFREAMQRIGHAV